jgi:hypothetical protein
LSSPSAVFGGDVAAGIETQTGHYLEQDDADEFSEEMSRQGLKRSVSLREQ